MMAELYRLFDSPLSDGLLFHRRQMLMNGRRDLENICCYRTDEHVMQAERRRRPSTGADKAIARMILASGVVCFFCASALNFPDRTQEYRRKRGRSSRDGKARE